MSDDLIYARVNGPPADYHNVEVCFEGKWSGDWDWVEVNADEGWGIRFAKDDKGQIIQEGNDAKRETIRGDFRLRRRGATQ